MPMISQEDCLSLAICRDGKTIELTDWEAKVITKEYLSKTNMIPVKKAILKRLTHVTSDLFELSGDLNFE